MPDKLSICNDALILTGNDTIVTLGDGTDEDRVATTAYDTAVKYALAGHDWNFGTDWVVPTRLGDSDDDYYTDRYQIPLGTLSVVRIEINGTQANYRIVGNEIYITPAGGTIRLLRVVDPGASNWPALFEHAVREFVMAGCYRGLNEDPVEAQRREIAARDYLQEARTRTDQQQRAGAIFVPRARNVRRTRRGI